MATYSDEVRDLVLGTVWSLWVELGLRGWERHHRDTAVDLEALILATVRLGDRDARLREEALDWAVANGRIASAVRLKHLAARTDAVTQAAMGTFAATVNVHARLNWPGATVPNEFVPTRRSVAPALERPALIQLRLRALWGVSARAEVLRVMLAEGHRFMSITQVADAAAFGKDAVADALDNLHHGGLLDEAGTRNQRLFRLGRRRELADLVGREPDWKQSWDWSLVLPIMIGFLEAAELPDMQPLARAAELHRRFQGSQPVLARLGVVPHPMRTGTDFSHDYEAFTMRALRTWAGIGE